MEISLRRLIPYGGAATLIAITALAITQALLGSPLFFALTAVLCAVYALLLRELLGVSGPVPEQNLQHHPLDCPAVPSPTTCVRPRRMTATSGSDPNRRLLIAALLFAVAFRVPLAVARVGPDSDMVRYLYDGRLQRLGYNPFTVMPSDPAVAATHTDDTRRMPSRNALTPYPAAAQLFFRLIVTVRESRRLMKATLVGCDLLTIAVLLAWLRSTRRSPWLALVYAWNPLVILEVAHSGHIDALGALWIAISAWMLSTGRGMRAMVAFVIAVATKLLPIVLLPLYWKRVRPRDALVAALVLAALYLPFRSAGTLPLGAVPNVVAFIRFNGPLFKLLAPIVTPQGAAAVALIAGLAAAAWFRFRTSADDPAAWAWPMAVSLAAAPVVYPWYLLYFTPFLFVRSTLPLIVWTYSVLPVYVVWQLARQGHRWRVPWWVAGVEYGVVLMVLIVLTVLKGAGAKGAKGADGAQTAAPLAPAEHL